MTQERTSVPSSSNDGELRQLLTLLWGFVPGRVLTTAVAEGFFEKFGSAGLDARLASELFDDLGWHDRPGRLALSILDQFGLVHALDGKVALTPLARRWLRRSSSHSIVSYFNRREKLERAYLHLDTVLATGDANAMMHGESHAAFGLNPDATRAFVNAMHASALEFGPALATHLSDVFAQRQKQRLAFLDVGCGGASLCEPLANTFPLAHIDAFDLSGVIEHARKRVQTQGIASRVRVHASRWQDWQWPEGTYDLVLLSQILHEFPAAEGARLFARGADALRPGGVIVVVLVGEVAENQVDVISNVFSLNILVEIGGDNPSVRWLDEHAKQASLVHTQTYPLPGARTMWIGRRAGRIRERPAKRKTGN